MLELSVSGLTCRRGARTLFRDLAWRAPAGTLVTVRGPNGAGKTSLLRLLAGLGLADAGEVRWRGAPIGDDRTTFGAELAWLGHADGLKGELTPRENLAFHAALHGAPAAARVDAALVELGIADAAGRPCRLLSAGQRRRAALARLRVVDAKLWILDEPLTALDADGQQLVTTLVSRHVGGGGIAVVTSHQPFAASGPAVDVVLG